MITTPIPVIESVGSASLGSFLYVVDSGNHRVQKLDLNGAPVLTFGGYGSANGQFSNPWGIASDGTNLYVTDTGNNRVQVFDLEGVFKYKFGLPGIGEGEFDGPRGIATDNVWLYVVDTNNARFHIFSVSGQWAASIDDITPFSPSTFDSPMGCAITGNILDIDDRGNGRIVSIALRYIDPNYLAPPIEIPVTLKSTYRLILTGASDGLPNVVLPMRNFSASLRTTGVTTTSFTVPFSTEIEEAINARPNGYLNVSQLFHNSDGSVEEFYMFTTKLEDATLNRGPRNSSITLTGRLASISVSGLVRVVINKVLFKSTSGGDTRYRVNLNPLVIPGNVAVIDGEEITIGDVSMSIQPSIATMEFKEFTES